MTEEFIIKLEGDFGEGVSASSKSGAGGTGSMLGGAAKLTAGIGIAMELLSIAQEVLGDILKPIKNIVTGILKMVGEFLRPIADLMVMVLKPILLLIKPFLDIFRSLMAPFIEIAREFSSMATQQMAGGNVSGAMSLSMSAVNAIIGPFVVSLTSTALQLGNTLFIEGVSFIIGNILDIMGSVMQHVPIIGGKIKESLDEVSVTIGEKGNEATTKVNELLMTATESILGGMQASLEEKLAETKERFPNEYASVMIETPAGAVAEMAKIVSADSKSMEDNMTAGLGAIDLKTTDVMDPGTGTIPATFAGAFTSMKSAVDGFVDDMDNAVDRLNSMSVTGPKNDRDDDDDDSWGSVKIKAGGFGFSYRT